MLTLLDLWTRFLEWNTFAGDLLYHFYRLGNWDSKEKRSVDLISVDPAQEVLSPVCSITIWEWQSCRSPAGPAPSGHAVLAPGMSLPRKLGGSSLGKKSSTHAESQCCFNGKRKFKRSRVYMPSLPLSVLHQCPLLPTHLDQNCQNLREKVVTKNKTTNFHWAFYIHFLNQHHHRSLFYRWGNWNRLKDVKQLSPFRWTSVVKGGKFTVKVSLRVLAS